MKGGSPLSIEVEHKSDIKQQLHEACHNMRQPIAVTLALAAAALTEPDLSDTTRERLERIIEQSEWLVDIINGCLAARGQVEPAEIENPDHGLADVVQVIGEVIAAERVTWPGEVALSAPAGPVWCAVPPVPLRRAISNVLDNAARSRADRHGDRRNSAVRRHCNARGGGRRAGLRKDTKRRQPGAVYGSQERRYVWRKNGM